MKIVGLLIILLSLTACGKSDSNCTNDDGTSKPCSYESYSSMALGDDCESYGDNKWVLLEHQGYEIAARCYNGTLGENKKDRLRCLRKDYDARLSSDERFAFCQDSQSRYSFLYDQSFGAHKPWRCDPSDESEYMGVDSNDQAVELVCDAGILTLASSAGSPSGETFDPESGITSSCKAKLTAQPGEFSPMKLEDFDPTVEVTETFKPDDTCKAPIDPATTTPDNISGSYLR
ncbi:MAG: hypothetical protein EOP10_23320 [Proteobacteria bacterium]|nr:MAG: hypothetical protein EOP10_23320 [Pseudomonadota bacterium]